MVGDTMRRGDDVQPQGTVRLLLAEPELAQGVPREELARAQALVRARVVQFEPGQWDVVPSLCASGSTSLLVLDGVLVSETVIAGCPSAELLGAGDLFSVGHQLEDHSLLPMQLAVTVAAPARIALLDDWFRVTASRWPQIGAALLLRSEHRAWRLVKQAAICHLRRVEARLVALFCHLADRWGRVTASHILLPLRLPHRTLGRLVGAERSTVTLALRQLAEMRLVEARADGAWLLSPGIDDELDRLTRGSQRPAASMLVDPPSGLALARA